MPSSPQYKIYNALNEYLGCMKNIHNAIAFLNLCKIGANIRCAHEKKAIIFTKKSEQQFNYDECAEMAIENYRKYHYRKPSCTK